MSKPAAEERLPPELRRRLLALVLLLLLLLGLTAAWRWTPLGDYFQPARAITALRQGGEALGLWLAVPVLTAALALAVPLSMLTLLAMVALGPWGGSAAILLSALLAAAFSQAVGRWLGHTVLLRLGGATVTRVSQSLARRGLWAVIGIRLVPLAPFAVVNMVIGSTHLRLRDMLLGTALGMLPATVAMALFTEQFLRALAQPGLERYVWIGGSLALVAVAAWALRRCLARA